MKKNGLLEHAMGINHSHNNTASTSMWSRDQAYKNARNSGGSPRTATNAFVSGNKWATENAKAVGNI